MSSSRNVVQEQLVLKGVVKFLVVVKNHIAKKELDELVKDHVVPPIMWVVESCMVLNLKVMLTKFQRNCVKLLSEVL